MLDNALRTAGVASKPDDSIIEGLKMEKYLIFVGLVELIDPSRPKMNESIQKAKLARIIAIMITGGLLNTAFYISIASI